MSQVFASSPEDWRKSAKNGWADTLSARPNVSIISITYRPSRSHFDQRVDQRGSPATSVGFGIALVRSQYPYLLQQRRRWFVRMMVPSDVRDIIGQSIFKVPTGHTDEHRASAAATPIIAALQDR